METEKKISPGTTGTTGQEVVTWDTVKPWIEHDLKLMARTSKMLKYQEKAMQSFLVDKFEEHARETPKKSFIVYEETVYTFELVDQLACKVACIAKGWGLGPRDCVAIMMQNEPSFVWTFLGLQKLGISVALINYNLKMHPLIQSVLAAEPKYLIVGPGEAILQAVCDVMNSLGKIHVYVQGLGTMAAPNAMQSFDSSMAAAVPTNIFSGARRDMSMGDTCCYIYTSGTTGNPKPALVSHSRSIGMGCRLQMVDLDKSDVLYIVLPLYHSSGGGIGLFGAITTGATIILRKKFSAHHFWSDCHLYNVTVILYIGELFRYLLAKPSSILESTHKVRAAFGNGLRKDIWCEVKTRFKIPDLVEFFGATEGVKSTFNVSDQPGAVGRLSPLLSMTDLVPAALVKFDFATATPIRDKNGFCIKVGFGEPGLFLAKVPEMFQKNGTLTVYKSSSEDNEKKIVKGAFTNGDLWLNYGDVLILDKNYFLYFSDRIGDTFRWKGENVSTIEVANVITALNFIEDTNVYGVDITGHEGRAGMAAITLKEGSILGTSELKEIYEHICQELPTYSRPLFLRYLKEQSLTGTFKQRKVELVNEGFDLNLVKDDLYFLDNEKKTYSKLTPADLSKFLSSKL